ncbi:MAG: hypothetical protein ACIWVG_22710 [Gloeotrichia echinulata HAB0833]
MQNSLGASDNNRLRGERAEVASKRSPTPRKQVAPKIVFCFIPQLCNAEFFTS